jgi:hypothetical protein
LWITVNAATTHTFDPLIKCQPTINWQITAQNATELTANFGGLGISVPERTKQKDQFAEEIYCLRRYLFPLANRGLLDFPIELVKRETPDFVFSWRSGNSVGLEVTKATRAEFEADLTRLDRDQKTRDYVSDSTTGAMLLSEAGWMGKAFETEWITYVLGSISAKLADFASYSVTECDLLIYDNTPLPAPDLKTVAEGVRLQFANEPLADKNGHSFRVISVILDPWVIYDVAHKPQVLRYDSAWDAPAD